MVVIACWLDLQTSCAISTYQVSDLRQVGGFLLVLRFPQPMKLPITIKLKYRWTWR